MARIRTIKPDAPTHRKTGKLSDRAFRLWLTMLTQADDEGRLVADPDQLRLLAFGYQPETLVEHSENALREIDESGLIRLYQVESSTRYAFFPSWKDHQRIDKPSESKLPAYSDTCRQFYEDSANVRRTFLPDRKGEEGKGEGVEGSLRETKSPSAPRPMAEITPQEFLESWNEICASEGLPAVQDLSNGRRRKITARLKTYPTLAFWDKCFNGIIQSEFLLGRKPGTEHPEWKATIDWLIKNDENPAKVVEGAYG